MKKIKYIWERLQRPWPKAGFFGEGYSEFHGIFCIAEVNGRLIPDVQVFYRVGSEGEWIPCGKSGPLSAAQQDNFRQVEPVFYKIGESISWQFVKAGYVTQSITQETSNPPVDFRIQSISLESDHDYMG